MGSRDALLCADHALFALDADVESLDELRQVYELFDDRTAARTPAARAPAARPLAVSTPAARPPGTRVPAVPALRVLRRSAGRGCAAALGALAARGSGAVF